MKEFDDVYEKEIAKGYDKHELKRLSTKRNDTEREVMVQADHSNMTYKTDF